MLIFNAIGLSHINYFNVLLMCLSKKDTDMINKQLIRTGSLILKLSKSKIDSTNWNLCIDLLNKYKNDLVKNLCNGKYITIKNTLICSSSKTLCIYKIPPILSNCLLYTSPSPRD